jgi:peptidoglycan/LPS O-acetylase OafA/YrhL
MENSRFDYIDVLRGIAILGVIAVHTGQYGDMNVPLFFKTIIDQGARGVQLFYLASAFTLIRKNDNNKHGKKNRRNKMGSMKNVKN